MWFNRKSVIENPQHVTRWGKGDKILFGLKYFTHLFLAAKNSWARMYHTVPFCLAFDNCKVESTKSNLKNFMALDQTLCFRAMKRNGLYLLSRPLAAASVKLQSVSPVVYIFCLEHVEQMLKGSILLYILSVGFMYLISNQFSLCLLCILSVCQCSVFVSKHWISCDVEALAYAPCTVQALCLSGLCYG